MNESPTSGNTYGKRPKADCREKFSSLDRRRFAVGGACWGGGPFSFSAAQRNFLAAVLESLPVILLGAVCTLTGCVSKQIDFRQPVAAMDFMPRAKDAKDAEGVTL